MSSDISRQYYLIKIIESERKKYQIKRRQSALQVHLIRLFAIICGATITILLGVRGYISNVETDRYLSIATIALSAMLTAVTSWEEFSNRRALWIHRIRIVYELCKIEDEIKFLTSEGEALSSDKLDEFFCSYNAAIRDPYWRGRQEDGILSPITNNILK